MNSHKITFSKFNSAADLEIDSLTEEELNEIFGEFFSKLSTGAKKKKEEELKKKIADTQAKIAANKVAVAKAKADIEKGNMSGSSKLNNDRKLPLSGSEMGQGKARAAERDWVTSAAK